MGRLCIEMDFDPGPNTQDGSRDGDSGQGQDGEEDDQELYSQNYIAPALSSATSAQPEVISPPASKALSDRPSVIASSFASHSSTNLESENSESKELSTPVNPGHLSIEDEVEENTQHSSHHEDMSQRLFRYFVDLRFAEESLKSNFGQQDLSNEVKSALQDVLNRFPKFKARLTVWRLARDVNIQTLTKESLGRLFWKLSNKVNNLARWIFIFFYLSDVLLLTATSSVQQRLEDFVDWSSDLVKEGLSPFARENGGWNFLLFPDSDYPKTGLKIPEETSESVDINDLYGNFKWTTDMYEVVKTTMKTALITEKNDKSKQSYKQIWKTEFSRFFPSFNVKNKTRYIRAKYLQSKKPLMIQKAMSRTFLQYLKLSVQTLITKKKTTTSEEIFNFLKDTKVKELKMEYPERNVKRSIRRASENFRNTGSTSLPRPGRPPMPNSLRDKIVGLSRNQRHRR